jgi:hypothetical protein
MGAYGAIRWPATSPDLNPLDFFIFISVKKMDSASMSGKTPTFFTECEGGYF